MFETDQTNGKKWELIYRTKNTKNSSKESWKSSSPIYFALTWQKQTTTAAAEEDDPRPARVLRRRVAAAKRVVSGEDESSSGARVESEERGGRRAVNDCWGKYLYWGEDMWAITQMPLKIYSDAPVSSYVSDTCLACTVVTAWCRPHAAHYSDRG